MSSFKTLPLSCITLACCMGAQAAGGNASRIVAVTIDPTGATVQRSANVEAGQKELTIDCLSERIDLNTLQLLPQGDGLRVGEVKIHMLDKAQAPECANPALTQRIRELEDQAAQIDAQMEAQDYALGWLKAPGAEGRQAPAASPLALQGVVETVQRQSQSRLLEKHQLQRRKEQLLEQIKPLVLERERSTMGNSQYRRLSIQLAARTKSTLGISYRSTQASWTPGYRAYLDTQSGQLNLERTAQVAQTSGEDWLGIRLVLSTARPQTVGRLNPPRPWRLEVEQAVPMAAAAPATAHRYSLSAQSDSLANDARAQMAYQAARDSDDEAAAPLPRFDLASTHGEYASVFSVPTPVDLSSSGQRTNFVLAKEALDSRMLARVQPDSGAYAQLVSVLPRPAGSWPSGPVELYRDGAYVGSSKLQLDASPDVELYWGPDEKIRVQRIAGPRQQAQTGFIGARQEYQSSRRWVVSNGHALPVNLQLLESGPVSENSEIKVERQYTPAPGIASWRDLPGVVAWQQPLAAGQSLTFEAHYVISAPKDVRLRGLPLGE